MEKRVLKAKDQRGVRAHPRAAWTATLGGAGVAWTVHTQGQLAFARSETSQAQQNLRAENCSAPGSRPLVRRPAAAKGFVLLAGEADDITTREQVFEAEHLVGTPHSAIVKKLAPGGHIGMFMGTKTLTEIWPEIGHWMKSHE